jgi:hypothetical protein
MQIASTRSAQRNWRRGVFWLRIAGSVALAAYLSLAGPLVPYVGIDYAAVALALPPFMVLLLASGFAWLVILAQSRRHTAKANHRR